MATSRIVLVTCEHAGNAIPAEHTDAFAGRDAQAWLRSHRGYDPGAHAAALQIATALSAQCIACSTTRLLADLNRSLGRPSLFSKFTRSLPARQQRELLDRHYRPYRVHVESTLKKLLARHRRVLHLSVHTFTPRIGGLWRPLDVGLLYDPARHREQAVCGRWRRRLKKLHPRLRVALNQPYAGIDDGFTTALRKLHAEDRYAGIEIEINNRFAKRSAEHRSGRPAIAGNPTAR